MEIWWHQNFILRLTDLYQTEPIGNELWVISYPRIFQNFLDLTSSKNLGFGEGGKGQKKDYSSKYRLLLDQREFFPFKP